MSETFSKMIPLRTKAPDFNLINPVIKQYQSLNELKSEIATVIMFICNHCPYVKHLNAEIVKLSNDYMKKSISFIAISSNDAEKYHEDSPAKMKEYALNLGYNFPYLYDETQETAIAYGAACTPDFYIFDKDLLLIYRGQFDDSRPGNGKLITGKDIRYALDAIIESKSIDKKQIPSIGCNIKWK
jgi:thiol-disulfide isomerase/thioredoxin